LVDGLTLLKTAKLKHSAVEIILMTAFAACSRPWKPFETGPTIHSQTYADFFWPRCAGAGETGLTEELQPVQKELINKENWPRWAPVRMAGASNEEPAQRYSHVQPIFEG